MRSLDELKLFHINRSLLDEDLENIQKRYKLVVKSPKKQRADKDNEFYPQFLESIRTNAKEMAGHYEIFYCLENSMRDLVGEIMLDAYKETWWDGNVPPDVKKNVQDNIQKELDAGVTVRSKEHIDYTTFGELSIIIDYNWDKFSDTFNSRKGLVSVLAKLNLLRAPIGHCSSLTEDEVLRLKLSLRSCLKTITASI